MASIVWMHEMFGPESGAVIPEASSIFDPYTQPDRLERLAALAGQPSQKNTVHANQPAVFLSHVNESATIRTSQPNRLTVSHDLHA